MNSDSITSRLKELHDLYKSEALTKDEYESLKKQILSEADRVTPENGVKNKDENIQSTNNPIQNKKSGKVWFLAIACISILIIVGLLVLKTGLLSFNSVKEYKINGKKVNATLLPPEGLYESNGNQIKVIISNGEMSFQQTYRDGSRNENFGNFDCDVKSGLILVMGTYMWTLEYKGNGIIEETMNGASTNNPPVIYKKNKESNQ